MGASHCFSEIHRKITSDHLLQPKIGKHLHIRPFDMLMSLLYATFIKEKSTL